MNAGTLTKQPVTTCLDDTLKLHLPPVYLPQKVLEHSSCLKEIRKVLTRLLGVHTQLFKAREHPHIFFIIALEIHQVNQIDIETSNSLSHV